MLVADTPGNKRRRRNKVRCVALVAHRLQGRTVSCVPCARRKFSTRNRRTLSFVCQLAKGVPAARFWSLMIRRGATMFEIVWRVFYCCQLKPSGLLIWTFFKHLQLIDGGSCVLRIAHGYTVSLCCVHHGLNFSTFLEFRPISSKNA